MQNAVMSLNTNRLFTFMVREEEEATRTKSF